MMPDVNTPTGDQIGRGLRGLRLQQGLELADVARRSGLTAWQIDDIEAGRIDPGAKELTLLAQALGASMAQICREIERRPQA